MSRARALAVAVACLAALAPALGACGVATQDRAVRVDPAEVPFGLLEAATTTTVVDEGRPEVVFLVADDRLVAVDRRAGDDASLADLLELVVAGPSDTERTLGITTAVPAGAVASAEAERGVAQVDLTEAFGDVRSDEQLLALGQLVYTLTQQPGIGGVSFTLDGEPVAVPLPDGTEVRGAVSRDDLELVAPR